MPEGVVFPEAFLGVNHDPRSLGMRYYRQCPVVRLVPQARLVLIN